MKKLFALILVMCLMLTTTAFAFSPDTTLDSSGSTGQTKVTYTASPTFTVTIPASVTLTNNTGTMNISIINAIFNAGQTVSVAITGAANYDTVNSAFRLSNGAETPTYLTYTICKGATLLTKDASFVTWSVTDKADAVLTLTANTPTIAGTYTDQLTSTVVSSPAA